MTNPKIAIIVHAYHLDVMDILLKYIKNMPLPFDLHVNFAKTEHNTTDIDQCILKLKQLYPQNFYYTTSENKGTDALGFVTTANQIIKTGKKYDYLCKIHTKKSSANRNPWGITGDEWARNLFETMLGDSERVQNIINIFEQDPEVGMIGSCDYLCSDFSNWHTIFEYSYLMGKLKLDRKYCYPQVKSFIAGTMFWSRGSLIEFFKSNKCDAQDFMNKSKTSGTMLDGQTEHAFERLFPAIIRQQGYKLFLLPSEKTTSKKPKIISFYFPQYHQMPENSKFWGKGFTEWDNLKSAEPKDKDHIMKHPHKSLGYYNLLDKKTRKMQANLAKEFGIYGFCYHHYWFSGKKVMYKPLELMLKDGQPDLPFCLNWANEPWTKNWDGLENEILLDQSYGGNREWDKHFDYLLKFFKHHNYIKIHNKPVFLIYRTGHFSQLSEMIKRWHARAIEKGFGGIYFVQCLGSFKKSNREIPKGMSAVCEYQPNFSNVIGGNRDLFRRSNTLIEIDKTTQWETAALGADQMGLPEKCRQGGIDYWRGFHPGWDNSPRRKLTDSDMCVSVNKNNYNLYLTKQLQNTLRDCNPTTNEKFLFLNSWNEWGEGCVMEPDNIDGFYTLEETKRTIDSINEYFVLDQEDDGR